MELLWTDWCFLLMLIAGFGLFVNGLRHDNTRSAVHRLLQQPMALCSAIILLFFLLIGVLDSIHMKTSSSTDKSVERVGQIYSVLDKIMAPLGQLYEKTYSMPLALNLFTTETVFLDGRVQQIYPRLKYPPASMQTEADKRAFISHVLWNALLTSLALVGLLYLIIAGIKWLVEYIGLRSFGKPEPALHSNVPRLDRGIHEISERRQIRNRYFYSKFIWGWITLFCCLFLVLASYWISRKLHLFGTGKIGQDIFYHTIKSIRTGLIIGTVTTLFMLPLAIILGVAAGYFGGVVDDIIQYIYTTLSSIPGVLLITASVLSMQTYIANHPEQFTTLDQSADARLLALCLILGVTSWTSLCRLLRAEVLKLREIDFVNAARTLGSGFVYIFRKHLLPNVMPIVLITLVLDFSFLILAEAVLSYVGVGVSPLTISWGNMINGARLELANEPMVWWPIMAAFIFMFVLVLASNIFADAVRDVFNPDNAVN